MTKRIQLLDVRNRQTPEACKSCYVDTGRCKKGLYAPDAIINTDARHLNLYPQDVRRQSYFPSPIWTPLRFFQNHSQTAIARTLKLSKFQFLPYRRILKNISGMVNDNTVSYVEVITKNDGANFRVKSLLNWKINKILIKSYLSKICT